MPELQFMEPNQAAGGRHLRGRGARLHALRARGERGARGGQVARAQVLQALPHRLQQEGHAPPARGRREGQG